MAPPLSAINGHTLRSAPRTAASPSSRSGPGMHPLQSLSSYGQPSTRLRGHVTVQGAVMPDRPSPCTITHVASPAHSSIRASQSLQLHTRVQALRGRRAVMPKAPNANSTAVISTDEAVATAAAAAPPLFGAGSKERVVVVGAGLAGVLAACLFAKRGYQVAVIEKRDLSTTERNGRTFAMTFSYRAVQAVQAAGLDPGIIKNNPLFGGMVMTGQNDWPSGLAQGEMYMVDRIAIGQQFIAAAQQQYPQEISFHFGYEVDSLDLTKRTVRVTPSTGGVAGLGVDEVPYDLLVAADGIFSRVRELCQQQDPDLHVKVLARSPTAYCTIHGLPALPNLPWLVDRVEPAPTRAYLRAATPQGWSAPWLSVWKPSEGSFTAIACIPTLIPALSWVADLVRERRSPDPQQLTQLKSALSPALELVPQEWQEIILQQLPGAKFSGVGHVTWCNKLTCDGVLLLGDAGHSTSGAMGQGANMAVEDVTVLSQVLEDVEGRNGTLDEAAAVYAKQRLPDVHSMQRVEIVHRKFLGHPVEPLDTSPIGPILDAWRFLAYKLSFRLGFKLATMWPNQSLFVSVPYLLTVMRVPYRQIWLRLHLQTAALLAPAVAGVAWLTAIAGRWILAAAGVA